MSWPALIAILRSEAGEGAAAIEARILNDLGGIRLSIPAKNRTVVYPGDIRRELRACRGNVEEVATRLGVSRSTVYRAVQPAQRPRPDYDAGPTMGGKILR